MKKGLLVLLVISIMLITNVSASLTLNETNYSVFNDYYLSNSITSMSLHSGNDLQLHCAQKEGDATKTDCYIATVYNQPFADIQFPQTINASVQGFDLLIECIIVIVVFEAIVLIELSIYVSLYLWRYLNE